MSLKLHITYCIRETEVKPGEVYPFRFFPHCRGPASGGNPPLTSLHGITDRHFHEGVSLDSYDKEQRLKDMEKHDLKYTVYTVYYNIL